MPARVPEGVRSWYAEGDPVLIYARELVNSGGLAGMKLSGSTRRFARMRTKQRVLRWKARCPIRKPRSTSPMREGVIKPCREK